MKRATPVLSDAEAAAYSAPFPDQSYKGGVRRFPELVMLKGAEGEDLTLDAGEGVETSLAARKFWSEDWNRRKFHGHRHAGPGARPEANAHAPQNDQKLSRTHGSRRCGPLRSGMGRADCKGGAGEFRAFLICPFLMRSFGRWRSYITVA